jgi:hypothetical protein
MDVFFCEGCGGAILDTEVAVAVYLSPDSKRRKWPRSIRRGWACAACVDHPCEGMARTFLDDGTWCPFPAVNPPAPCEGCGQLISVRGDRHRRRVTCRDACLDRTNPSQRDQAILATAATECQACGTRLTTTWLDCRYCSRACQQRAYRARVSALG